MKQVLPVTICLFLFSANVFADTLIIVGVVVDKSGQRLSGALVRLYGTAHATGQALAEDRTSERGIFSLYRTNIAGDLGELFVVYHGDVGLVANPLKVSVTTVQPGLIQSRTADLVVLTAIPTDVLSSAAAADQIAAITNTQAVLAQVGVVTNAQADAQVAKQTEATMLVVGWSATKAAQISEMTAPKINLPADFKGLRTTAMATIKKKPIGES